MSMERTFAGKVALVTGSGKNIGRAIALDLAQRGASVVVNGRSDRALVDAVVAEINAMGSQGLGCIADVTDPEAVRRMIDQAVAAFGGIDIVVSNAGLRRQTPFWRCRWRNGARFCRWPSMAPSSSPTPPCHT